MSKFSYFSLETLEFTETLWEQAKYFLWKGIITVAYDAYEDIVAMTAVYKQVACFLSGWAVVEDDVCEWRPSLKLRNENVWENSDNSRRWLSNYSGNTTDTEHFRILKNTLIQSIVSVQLLPKLLYPDFSCSQVRDQQLHIHLSIWSWKQTAIESVASMGCQGTKQMQSWKSSGLDV